MTLTTAELRSRLRRNYIKPGQQLAGGIYLDEVGWNPAGGATGNAGTCDAIYVGFTQSSGRMLIGHELKVSRADWLNELNKPGKADPWADQCHEWYLVVPDPAIVHEGELPYGWGLMVPGRSKTRMETRVAAARKPADFSPSWLATRSIMARLDTLQNNAVNEIRRNAAADANKDMMKRVDELVKAKLRDRPSEEDALTRLKVVETALERTIHTGDGYKSLGHVDEAELREIGAAIKKYGSVKHWIRQITVGYDNPIDRTRAALKRLEDALAEMKDVAERGPSEERLF